MGRPKAWLQIGDELLLSRMVRIIGLVVSPVVAATRRGLELPPLPLDTGVAYDAEGTAGPLAGIAAGFDALCGRCDAAFVAACDHVLLSAAFVKRMIELLADHDAVVPEHGGRLFPTVALYRLKTRAMLGAMLAAGEFRAKELVARCMALRVKASDFADIDPKMDSLRNINTPEDLRDILRIVVV